MRGWTKWILALSVLLSPALAQAQDPGLGAAAYARHCAACHSANLTGGEGPSLLAKSLPHGADDASMVRNIRAGFPPRMPPFAGVVSEPELAAIVAMIGEKRATANFRLLGAVVPTGVLRSDLHDFRVETVARFEQAYGFDFLPDGRILLTETAGRLRVIEKGRVLPQPIAGAPTGQVRGPVGSSASRGLADVIVHPDYRRNGWVYVATSEKDTSKPQAYDAVLIRIHRGRIANGRWLDGTVIAEIPNDQGGARRLAFDRQGHLYVSVPFHGTDYQGAPQDAPSQTLTVAGGKILRMNDDGSVPADNPYAGREGITRYIWTFGHRVALGLAFSPTGDLWETENGPRGGDEINRLRSGRNYGWPISTWGHRYDDRPVGANPDPAGFEQPLAAYVPAPSLSQIGFYTGDAFPRWKGSLFMGTLKQRNLYRVRFDGDRLVSQEMILHDFDRVRDLGEGPDGLLYILTDSGTFVRLVPADPTRQARTTR